jgi:GT2 family glycosyltransferase
VVLNDDASTDGTAAMASSFPFVRVIHGSGHDYWAGGMRRAWEATDLDAVDALLLLNDDVQLDEDAIARLLKQLGRRPDALWGGPVRGEGSPGPTYGGNVSSSRLRRMKLRRLEVGDDVQQCDVLNGNVVLMSTEVARLVGNLDPSYRHGMADYDLSWRAQRLGIASMVVPGTVGSCDTNSVVGTWQDRSLSRADRWRKLMAPTGLPPRPYLRICAKHGGPLWPLDFLSPYVRVLVGA